MKTLLSVIALSFMAVSFAAAGEPVNTKCPVSGKPVDSSKTVDYKGKTVGFCCSKCQAKFEAEPEKFAGKVK